MPEYFKLNNSNEILRFESYLKSYYGTRSHFDLLPYLDLISWFDFCQKNQESGAKIFTAILDIKINLLFVDIERTQVQQMWEGKSDVMTTKSIIEDFDFFHLSFDLFESLSTYIFKYRALLDKIMGLIVLYFSPENYNKFRRGDSRKKIFKSIFENNNIPINLSFQNVFDFLEQFDERLRTPEAHATGSIRKWVLAASNVGTLEFGLIPKSWSNLIYIISEIDKIKLL
jgi:hypothetical protein